MNAPIDEVKKSELAVGDIINVSFKSDFSENLYLTEKVVSIEESYVETEDRGFLAEYSRYYIVEKAKRALPTEIGSAVKQIDDWKYIRIGDNSWKGIEPTGHISKYSWTDAEVASTEWEQIA